MTPGSFDPVTAREVLGDELTRRIEADARKAVDEGRDAPNTEVIRPAVTYWDGVTQAMRKIVWDAAFEKRVARKARLDANTHGVATWT